jgi:hypothetical protein
MLVAVTDTSQEDLHSFPYTMLNSVNIYQNEKFQTNAVEKNV